MHGAAAALRQAAQSLQVHPQRMLGHVRGLHGLVFSEACVHAMAHWTGKPEALAAVELLAPQALEQANAFDELFAGGLNQVIEHESAPMRRTGTDDGIVLFEADFEE